MKLEDLLREVELVTPEGGAWCSVDKSRTLATLVALERPSRILEIGVWAGGSAIPMAIALRYVGRGMLVAIDPWSVSASVAGQDGVNAEWWGRVDHDAAYRKFTERVMRHGLAEFVATFRARSDAVALEVIGEIDLCHIDGNHGEQAVPDVERFAPRVRAGGLLVLDDVDWEGGHVRRAHQLAMTLGFSELFTLGTGCVLRRSA